ncbi:hypothetical protein D2V17_02590 [Aurantiacibacter xanthus]|uniref:Uncharacterized protein n=1 Tax=Aurantiacibacter xanthus TaxID=1784712 RepID=A0A3A1PE28_9SPHN|nr:hypothetical protein [Aurantiacibacter xanthus]RIV91845.1 hypothetical protein D2V17_02590 [Aurantiacibacter xanthus]
MLAIAGFGAQMLGIGAWSQAQGSQHSRLLFWTGLALLLCSTALMIARFGTAPGIAWAFLTISLVAYARFVPQLVQVPHIGRDAFRRQRASARASRGGKLGLALRLVAAGPLYLIAALAVGAVAATKLPWAEVNRLMFGGLIVPVIWATGALHATADLRLARVLGAPLLITAIFAGIFFAL